MLSENSESNAYIRHQLDTQSPADISWNFGLKYPLVHWPTWGGVRGSSPLPRLLPGTFGAWRTIFPLLDNLGRHITANFRKDGIKGMGVLMVVSPPPSPGCHQHRPSTWTWRFCKGYINHNNQATNTDDDDIARSIH